MKKLAKLFSIMITLAIIITALPMTMTSAEVTPATDYVIFAADPSKLGESGTKATPSDLNDSGLYTNGDIVTTVYTDTSGEKAKYKWSLTFPSTGMKYPRTVIDMGYSSEDIPWIADATVLNALAGKVTVSMTGYADGALKDSGNNTGFSVCPIDKTTLRYKADDNTTAWSMKTDIGTLGTRTETTMSVKPANAFAPFASGYFFMNFSIMANTADAAINWELYDIKFTINSDDKAAIDEALAAAESEWTFESMVAAYENRDYEPVDEVIFAADPTKLGKSGTQATPSDLTDANLYTNGTLVTTAYTDLSGEKAKYEWSHTFSTTGMYYPRTTIDMGYSSEEIPWIADADVLNALAGKLTVSVTGYADGNLLSGSNNTGVKIYPVNATDKRYTGDSNDPFTLQVNMGSVGTATEITLTAKPENAFKPFGSGYLYIETSIKANYENATINWEFYDIQFTINTDDKAAIDAALAEAGSEWTFDSIVQAYKDRDLVKEPADGNMNDDDKVDILDAVILASKLKASAEITDAAVVAAADLSGDGKVTAADLSLLRKARLDTL